MVCFLNPLIYLTISFEYREPQILVTVFSGSGSANDYVSLWHENFLERIEIIEANFLKMGIWM